MTQLVEYLVKGLVSKPDAIRVHAVEGEASVLLELSVDPADLDQVKGPDGETLRSIRTLLSASAGKRKAVLELLEPSDAADDRSDDEDDDLDTDLSDDDDGDDEFDA